MPKVVLIGDSIRIGYEPYVIAELEGICDVWGPTENGGDSNNALCHLDEWVIDRQPDIIHLNCGLHDMKIENDLNNRQIPLDKYTENVKKIIDQIVSKTNAILIWATTTPVHEKNHRNVKGFIRLESDVEAYNTAATAIAQNAGLTVNDLNQVITSIGRDELLLPDGVHFTDDAYKLLGEKVTEIIKQQLAK